MIMNLQFFKKSIDVTQKTQTPLKQSRFIYPMREWFIGLIVTIILFSLGASYLAYDFYVLYHSLDQQVVTDETVVSYRGKQATAVLKTYADREARFNELRADHPPVTPRPTTMNATSTSPTTTSAVLANPHAAQ